MQAGTGTGPKNGLSAGTGTGLPGMRDAARSGNGGRAPTRRLPCRRHGQYPRWKERCPPTDEERASWRAAERDRLEREAAEAEAGQAGPPF